MSNIKHKLTKNTTTSFCNKKDNQWIHIDATNVVVGRLASFIAHRLRGKHTAHYTPNADCGDRIIVTNCDKMVFTGKKTKQKVYYHHTGYAGGIKERLASQLFAKNSTEILKLAVKRMISKGSMAYKRLSNLYLFCGSEHDKSHFNGIHIDFKSINKKNGL